MQAKYLGMMAVASVLSIGMVTGCANPESTSSPDATEQTESNPCAGKENPCASKEDPCASANPCASADPCASKGDPCAGS